jgi:hypothetical protein
MMVMFPDMTLNPMMVTYGEDFVGGGFPTEDLTEELLMLKKKMLSLPMLRGVPAQPVQLPHELPYIKKRLNI